MGADWKVPPLWDVAEYVKFREAVGRALREAFRGKD